MNKYKAKPSHTSYSIYVQLGFLLYADIIKISTQ